MLTVAETAAVLFHNETPVDRSIIELLEAKNHQTVLNSMFEQLRGGTAINETILLQWHAALMNGVLPDAGRYRTHGVRIVGLPRTPPALLR